MAAMGEEGITRLKLKNGESELLLEKGGSEHICATPVMAPPVAAAAPAAAPIQAPAPAEPADGTFVTAPMVGTFYSTPSPEAPPFVKVGDQISEDTVVCIVEAMKVMNEVKAGVKGTVKEVLVDAGHPVEFGTKLFLVG